jgi:hypothetical protein
MKAKLAFISAHCSTYSIRLLCSVLGVARSWFHDWQAGAQARSAESRTEADLVGQSGAFSRTAASAMGLRASMPNCGPAASASPASGSPGS